MFDLRQLKCFVAVGEELHFGRAAKRMYMTQPPLSRQIQLLEHELEIQLLVRTNRSVKLTVAGSAFLQEARQLLALAENAASSAQRIATGQSGLINLGFTGGSSYSFLPRMLASTNASLNNIDIVLHEMMTRSLVEALHAHAIDISLLRLTSQFRMCLCCARTFDARRSVGPPPGHWTHAYAERPLRGTLHYLPSDRWAVFFRVDRPDIPERRGAPQCCAAGRSDSLHPCPGECRPRSCTRSGERSRPAV
jgi:DNA-binding transcriptional LysR family regulator